MNGTDKRKADHRDAGDWAARVTAGAKFSVLVHAIAFVVGGLILFAINLLLSFLVDGRWLLAEPMTWWGAALILHAVTVPAASGLARLRQRFSTAAAA